MNPQFHLAAAYTLVEMCSFNYWIVSFNEEVLEAPFDGIVFTSVCFAQFETG